MSANHLRTADSHCCITASVMTTFSLLPSHVRGLQSFCHVVEMTLILLVVLQQDGTNLPSCPDGKMCSATLELQLDVLPIYWLRSVAWFAPPALSTGLFQVLGLLFKLTSLSLSVPDLLWHRKCSPLQALIWQGASAYQVLLCITLLTVCRICYWLHLAWFGCQICRVLQQLRRWYPYHLPAQTQPLMLAMATAMPAYSGPMVPPCRHVHGAAHCHNAPSLSHLRALHISAP